VAFSFPSGTAHALVLLKIKEVNRRLRCKIHFML